MRDLDDLAAFLAVAETSGFTRAADKLHISKSMVSRRVARLEADLGVRLLARTTRGVAATEAGEALAGRARTALDALDAAFDDAARRDGELQGRLRLSVPLSFGVRHLAPPLAAFAVAHPKLELDVSYSDRVVDVIADGWDAAVRIGAMEDSSLVARRLAPVRGVAVASPAYLAAAGWPERPRDLARHACIVYSGGREADLWRFREGDRWVSVRVNGRVRADNGDALREAAVAGLGIAAMPSFLAAPALERGEVVPVLAEFPRPESALYVVRPPGPATTKVRALIDFLAERFAGEPTWDPCWNVRARETQPGLRAVSTNSL